MTTEKEKHLDNLIEVQCKKCGSLYGHDNRYFLDFICPYCSKKEVPYND